MRLTNLIIITSAILLLGAGDPKAGKDKVAVCAGCHGLDGNSLVGIWPSLAGQNQNYLLKHHIYLMMGLHVHQNHLLQLVFFSLFNLIFF